MPYAILRTAKLTSLGNVGGSAQHNFRERFTANADPARTGLNQTRGAQSSREVIEAVKERLASVPKVRKNAVLAIEYFIGASPEWFKERTDRDRESYFDLAEKWLMDRHGAENVITVTRQYDETSPHICAYVVPIDHKGKLNCSNFLDGREKLSKMQTDFAEVVGHKFSLELGIEGSKAEHQTIKEYYSNIQKPVQKAIISPDAIQPKLIKKTFWTSTYETPEKVARRLTETVQAVYSPTVDLARQHSLVKAENKAKDEVLANLRSLATLARDLPLEGVLERLACQRDPDDRRNWRTPAGRLTVTGAKFYAHDIGKGGAARLTWSC